MNRRLKRRPVRRVCLDLRHRNPDLPCPYCDPTPDTDPVIALATRQHADLITYDAELWGWPA
ncbi:hypothetical protein [Polymorphospora sp. NPDC050346]|uniref:hypothetical protein n=1 Tax=Polymorphospora sp. NPDC050346 TaxID=3155780 RepID=UPI0033C0562B